MKSVQQMLEKLEGMVGTDDLNEWETKFVTNNVQRMRDAGGDTSHLTEKVVETIKDLHDQHFPPHSV